MPPAEAPVAPGVRRLAEAVQLWLLPTAGLAASAAWWRALGLGREARAVALAFPALVSTGIVAVGAWGLGLWRFRVGYVWRGVPVWIGLVYSGTLNLAFAAVASRLGVGVFTQSPASAASAGAAAGGLAGVAYDLAATRAGLLEPPARVRGERRGTVPTVMGYGPAYFGGLGAVCGLALWAGARRRSPQGRGRWLAMAATAGAVPFWVGVGVLAWRHRTPHAETTPHTTT